METHRIGFLRHDVISAVYNLTVYARLVHPPLKFPFSMENGINGNLTKNPTNIYQAQVAYYGETTDKFDVK